jgi:Fungal chitosanase of glycosyl hydrolase group 75
MTGIATKIDKVGESFIRRFSSDSSIFFYRAGMSVDADGSPHAYHKDNNKGLDLLEYAGEPGNWWALVTDDDGDPVIQDSGDPAPGFYISITALEDQTKEERDPRRYVDAEKIPYFVLPGDKKFGAKLGDFGFVVNPSNGKSSGCIFADIGPDDEIGEGSIALAKALEIDSDPKSGGIDDGLAYVVFPGTRNGWPISADIINNESTQLFDNWGGLQKIKNGLPNLDWKS